MKIKKQKKKRIIIKGKGAIFGSLKEKERN